MKAINQRIDLGYVPRKWQQERHRELLGKKAGLWICSRQIGKTVAALAELIHRTLTGPPNTDTCYICPAQTQARRIAWPQLKESLRPMGNLCELSETKLTALLPGNRRIHVLGAESGENLRGMSLRVIVADERDNISDQFWRSVMLPTLNEYGPDAFVLYIGTLAGADSTLWKLYLEHRDDPDWSCALVTAEDSGVFTPEWLTTQRQAMGESAYRREMLCDPAAPVENAVLGEEVAESEREGRILPVPYRPGMEVITSWDLGIRDFTSVWGYGLVGRTIEVLFYREYAGLSTVDVITRLLHEFPRYKWGECVLPHDAKQREKSSGFTVADAFWDRWPGYTHVFKSAPSPVATLQAARINIPRCYFDARGCEKGLLRLKSASYVIEPKTGTVTDRMRHDDNSHAVDAFRYGMWRIETMYPSTQSLDMGARYTEPKVYGSFG